MHNKLNGDLDIKIDEMHHVMLSLKASIDNSPMIWPRAPERSRTESAVSQISPPVSPSIGPKKGRGNGNTESSRSMSATLEIHTPQETPELSGSEFSAPSPPSRHRSPPIDVRESLLIPLDFQFGEMLPQYEERRKQRIPSKQDDGLHSPKSLGKQKDTGSTKVPLGGVKSPASPQIPHSSGMLPPPAIPPDTALSDYGTPNPPPKSLYQKNRDSDLSEVTGVATSQEQSAFERNLFTHSTVLCEV